MGCLRLFIKIFIVILAIIGFKTIGGFEMIKKIQSFNEPVQQEAPVEQSASLKTVPDAEKPKK